MTRTMESHETALTLINQASFYADAKEVMQAQAARIVKGTYSRDKAVAAFTRLISQHVNGGKEWREVYAPWKPTVADRKLAAVEVLEHYSEQLAEIAADLMGPEWVQVNITDFDHDSFGNPTARHLVFTSTDEGGMVKRLNADWKPRRLQVGYANTRDDSVGTALASVGIKMHNYTSRGYEGSRSDGEVRILFERNAVKVEV